MTSKPCWIKVVRKGILFLFLILEKMLFTIEYDVSYGFVIYGLRYVEGCSLCAHFLRVFIINECWILSKVLSASTEMIIMFLFFNLLMWCITLIDLQILKNPCISGINPTWSWCMILLMYCWSLFARTLLRIFASMFISDTDLWFSFFCDVFVWFWYQGDGGTFK